METVFVAHVFSPEGSTFVGVYSTPDKAKVVLQTRTESRLDFHQYTIKTSGRRFWVATDPETVDINEEYSVKEEWVQ